MVRFPAAAMVIALSWFWPQSVSACSCLNVSRQELRDLFPISFNGRVVKVERLGEAHREIVKAIVDVVWPLKGAPPAQLTIYSRYAGGWCGSGRELFEAQATGEVWEFNISPNSTDPMLPRDEMQVGYCSLRPMEFGTRELGRRARGLTDR